MSPPSYGRTPTPERGSYGRSGSGETLPGTSSGAYAAFARGARNSTTKLTTSGRVPTALRSTHPVSPLGRRPRGLRLVEEVQQLPLSELSERCVGTLGSQRRIASEAALALGARPELEQQSKFVLPVDRDTARGINLPDAAVHYDGGSGQGRGPRHHASPGRR